jgi:hypothetical protein
MVKSRRTVSASARLAPSLPFMNFMRFKAACQTLSNAAPTTASVSGP